MAPTKKHLPFILGLVSHRGSGKDLFGQYLTENYPAKVIVMSRYISQALELFHLPPNRHNFPWLITKIRKHFGRGILARAAIREIGNDGYQIYLINGVRLKREVEILRENFGKRFVVVNLACDNEIRFQRIKKREKRLKVSKDNVDLSLADFVKQEKQIITEREISFIEKKADFIVENNGTQKELFKGIDTLIKNFQVSKIKSKK
jgi:dephospho-CoA kinase